MPWISRWKLGSKVIGSVGCITPIDPICMYRSWLQPIYQKLLPSWDIQVGMFEYLFTISTRFQPKNSTKSPHVLSHLPWVLVKRVFWYLLVILLGWWEKKTSNYKNWADIGWFFLKTYPDIGECIHRHMFSYLRSLTILIQRFLFSKTTMARENLFWRCIFYRTCSMGLEHLPTFPMGPM